MLQSVQKSYVVIVMRSFAQSDISVSLVSDISIEKNRSLIFLHCDQVYAVNSIRFIVLLIFTSCRRDRYLFFYFQIQMEITNWKSLLCFIYERM